MDEHAGPWRSKREPVGGLTAPLDVAPLARNALRELASRAPPCDKAKLDFQIRYFCEALIDLDPGAGRSYAAKLSELGFSPEEMIDRLIPAAARLLGEKWVNDEMSFCVVTIGSARLQELTRFLERATRLEPGPALRPRPIVIATPVGEQHSLGALIAASRLRRLGFDVRLEFELDAERFANLSQYARFEALALSCASRNHLDGLNKLMNNLRLRQKFCGPIAVGGPIAQIEDAQVSMTPDADLLTDDLHAFAGLIRAG